MADRQAPPHQGPPPQGFPPQGPPFQGPPPQGPPFQGPPPQGPPPKRRKGLLLGLVAAAVVLLCVVGVLGWLAYDRSQTQDEVRSAATEFTRSVLRGDQKAVSSALCQEERTGFDAAMTPVSVKGESQSESAGSDAVAVKVDPVEVRDDTARAEVTIGASPARPLYLRHEDGTWKACAPARGAFDAAG